jgi:hypothetical protein
MKKNMENLQTELDSCNTLTEIFELVKPTVKRFLNRQRSGLMLGLTALGMKRGYFLGAFHPIGSNIIVVNRKPLDSAMESKDKKVFNAYCFHLLLHEYLHSLGYVEEDEVKDLTQEVCKLALGDKHPATMMAVKGVAHYFPKVKYFRPGSRVPRRLPIELIKDFDRRSTRYIQ